MFAHSGDLPGIERSFNLAYDRYRPVGTSDSEHAFCALLERFIGTKVSFMTQRMACMKNTSPSSATVSMMPTTMMKLPKPLPVSPIASAASAPTLP